MSEGGRKAVSQTDANEENGGGKTPSASRRKPRHKRTGDVGAALRSVYDKTVNEEIPPDFLDLLGKLD